jgi:16S rRNA processing protein RimM
MNDPNAPIGIQIDKENTDSPAISEPVFLAVGRLRQAHGVRGEINLEIFTDFPERLHAGGQIYVGEEHKLLRIASIRPKDRLLLLSFEGYDDRDEVQILRNEIVYSRSDQIPKLPEDHYYHHQLIGLKVIDDTGITLGSLIEIFETGANDVYVVRPVTGKEILLPAIESVILKVDLERQEITVHQPVWL